MTGTAGNKSLSRLSRNEEELRKFDDYTYAVSVIQENHRLIHDGMFHTLRHYDAALANAANMDILITTPAFTYPHLQAIKVTADEGDLELKLYEDVTTSADGTALACFNRNRNSSTTPDSVFTHTPTVTDLGTVLPPYYIPGGGAVWNPTSILFDERTEGEFVLKPSSKFLLRVTNNSGSARIVEMRCSIYELGYGKTVSSV